jgi:predicted unusual protein kinase regulating ubiquinone biosynthesis (AarF/ABC1/UbiB family)
MLFIILQTIYILFKEFFLYKVFCKKYSQCIRDALPKLSKLNILYAKLIQWVICSNDKDLTDFIQNFSDKVEYTDNDIDYKSIINLYKSSVKHGDVLDIETMPINSGTVALVFKGTLNGSPVAVKILRNNIDNELRKAIKLFKTIGNILYYLSFINNSIDSNLTDVIIQSSDLLISQINFTIEVSNIQKFSNVMKNDKIIVIPKVYPYYTEENTNTIVMEFIQGNKITVLNEEEKTSYIEPYFTSVTKMILDYGIVHSDLHSGNILFLPNHKIALLDFGIITLLNVEHQTFMFDFFTCFTNSDPITMVNHLLDNPSFVSNITAKNKKNILKEIEYLRNTRDFFVSNTECSHYDILLFIRTIRKEKIIMNKSMVDLLLSTMSTIALNDKLSDKFYEKNSDLYRKFLKKITFSD